MAWNGSSEKGKAPALAPKPVRQSPPSKAHGLIALVVIVIAGGLAAWFFLGRDVDGDASSASRTGKSKIAEVKPQLSTNDLAQTEAADAVAGKSPKPEELPPQKVGEIRNGYRLLGNGKLHKVNGVITNSLAHRRVESSIFKHSSENIIAGILSAKPGAIMVGTPNYNGAFTKDFFDSLQDPIVINPDDSEKDKELKAMVIEAKQTLKEAMDRGEDVEKIILDARKECQELARYKQVLQKDVFDYVRKEDVTEDDVDLYVEAANKMLEEKGIAPINPSAITRLKMRMKKEN